MNGGRKRARSPDAECEECMPISKRIHNLNIRSQGCNIDEDRIDGETNANGPTDSQKCCCTNNTCRPRPSTSSSTESSFWPPDTATPTGATNTNCHQQPSAIHQHQQRPSSSHLHPNSSSSPSPHHQHLSVFSASQEQHDIMMNNAPYEPELDASENPHYYHTNRLLYDAHNQRIRRFKSNTRLN